MANKAKKPKSSVITSVSIIEKEYGKNIPGINVSARSKSKNTKKTSGITKETHEEHKCPTCNKVFPQRYYLQKHMQLHVTEKNFHCHLCPRSFTHNEYLQKHIKSIHTVLPEMTCTICKKVLRNKYNLQVHMWRHKQDKSPKKVFKCEVCDQPFPSDTKLVQHIEKVHLKSKELTIGRRNPRNPITCPECGASFSAVDSYERHLLSHKNIQFYSCDICREKFKEQSSLEIHLELHAKGKIFLCEICKRSFSHKHAYEKHITSHEELIKKCFYCEESFEDRHKRRNHIKASHKGLPTFKTDGPPTCTICKGVFENLDILKTHIKTHFTTRYECTYCKKLFAQLPDAYQHTVTQHPGRKKVVTLRKVKNDDPNKQLPTTTKLVPETLFECALCSKKCKLKSNLANHMSIHIRSKNKSNPKTKSDIKRPLKCLNCNDDAFEDATTLLRHVRLCKENFTPETPETTSTGPDIIWLPVVDSIIDNSFSDMATDTLALDSQELYYDLDSTDSSDTYKLPTKNVDHTYAYMGT